MVTWLRNNPNATVVISLIATFISLQLGLAIGGLSGVCNVQGLLNKSWNPGFAAILISAITVPFLIGLFAGSAGSVIAVAFVNYADSNFIGAY